MFDISYIEFIVPITYKGKKISELNIADYETAELSITMETWGMYEQNQEVHISEDGQDKFTVPITNVAMYVPF